MRWCLVVVNLLVSFTTLAETTVMSTLTGLDQAQGGFAQQVYSEEGRLLYQASGRFAVLPPTFFRWQTLSPASELLLIDGDFLWQYDEDLLTVIRRPVPDDAATPLQLLFSDLSDIVNDYEILESQDRLHITPLDSRVNFQSLTVMRVEDEIHLALIDALAQRSVIVLRPEPSGPIDRAQFQMVVPDDTDLIIQEGVTPP